MLDWDDLLDSFRHSGTRDAGSLRATRVFRKILGLRFLRGGDLRPFPTRAIVALAVMVAALAVVAAVAPPEKRWLSMIALELAALTGILLVRQVRRIVRGIRCGGSPFLLCPVGPPARLVFAEALQLALTEGLPLDDAMMLAAEVTPHGWFQTVLPDLRWHVRSGYSLAESLTMAQPRADRGLVAALSVGEENGCLAEELAAYTRARGLTVQRFHAAIGPSRAASRFATILARLLEEGTLSPQRIAAAGRSAALGEAKFSKVIATVVEQVADGGQFADALRRGPRDFDRLFVVFVAQKDSRQALSECLGRLGVLDFRDRTRRGASDWERVHGDRPRQQSGDPVGMAALSNRNRPSRVDRADELRIVIASLEPIDEEPPADDGPSEVA